MLPKPQIRTPEKGSTTSSYSTNDGFLIYGLPTPTGSIATSNVASVMASQTGTGTTPGGWEPNANYSNGTERNTAVNVVTASSFVLSLNTVEANLQVSPTQVYHDQDADGDNAQFTIDGGTITVAANGTTSTTPTASQSAGVGQVDTITGDVSYGYQNFANSSPGYYNANGNGAYSQTIDTANLSIGYHYLEVISFRHNPDPTAPPVYSDWYDTIYVDRGTPTSSVQSFAPFASAPTTYENRQFDIQSDGTATSEYVYLNLPAGITNAQILNMVTTGNNTINGVTYQGGLAGQIDQTLFAYGFSNLQNGNNVGTVVSYRPDGNDSIQRFTASEVPDLGHSTLNGLGLGDLNEDGHINTTDVFNFSNNVAGNGMAFNPAADMNGLGFNDVNDWLLFGQELVQNNLLSTSNAAYVSSSTISYYNALSPTVPTTIAAGTSYGLQIPSSTATLGSLTMNAGSTLNVTGAGSGANTPYSVTFGGTSVNSSVTFNVSNNGSGLGSLNLGALNDHNVASAINFTGNGIVNLNSAGSLLAATTVAIGTGSTLDVNANGALGGNGVAINNNGALVVNGNQTVGTISGAGSVTVGNGTVTNTLKLATNTGGSSMSSLTINGNSVFDINNNHFTDATTGTSTTGPTFSSILGYIKSGAIISSAGLSGYGVGLVDGNDGVLGTTVPTNQIEVAYTLDGDANLDGNVNITDFNIFAPNFGLPTTLGWEAGDFGYYGTVNIADFNLFAANFGLSDNGTDVSQPAADMAALDAFAAVNGLLVNVPEPATTSFLVLNMAVLLTRRRRNTNPLRHLATQSAHMPRRHP